MLYLILLVLVEILLFAANYIHGTYLIGWDNIMPELNLSLNLKRSLFSVWQEYRGLGLLDGMSHAANLFHTIYIAILSVFLPQSIVRYVFIHLTHLLGGIGIFYLLKSFTKNSKASFVGALFYMLNLGVIQMYYAPLEVFAVHFAALPFLMLFIKNALIKPDRKNLLFLFLASLLGTPQGFVPTVFIAFFILFLSMLFFFFLSERNIKRVFIVFFIVIAANAFWVFPYIYSSVNTAKVIQQTRINQFSSEEIFYRNYARGDLLSVLTFKGFMLDSVEFDQNNKNVFLMENWREHVATIPYQAIFALILMTMGIGVFKTIKDKKKEFYPFLAAFLISFSFLANNTPVTEQLNNLIRTVFPVVGEAFRFPFTKFITLFVFSFSVFFALGVSVILKAINNLLNKRSAERILFSGIILGIIFISFPAFSGYFTSPFLKLKIPEDYLESIRFFNSEDQNQRVALFPANTFWNWEYRSWGHRGSGFLWYGLGQPLLERAFDPWSNYNEQFYNEIAYSLTTNNPNLFEKTLKKYDIKYIFLDQYIRGTLPGQPINYGNLKKFIEKNSFLRKKTEFGKIIVYETALSNSWVYSLDKEKTVSVSPVFSNEFEDNLNPFSENYIIDPNLPDVISLFPSLYTGKLQENLEFDATQNENSIILIPKKDFKNNIGARLLELPSLFNKEFLIPVAIKFEKGTLTATPIYPKLFINGKEISAYDQQITVRSKYISKAESITLMDTNQVIENPQTHEEKAYILNKYPNLVKLRDANGNEETIIIDTQNTATASTLIMLGDEKINSLKIVVDKIKTPLSFENIIGENKYEIKEPSSVFNPFSKDQIAKIAKQKDEVYFEAKGTSRELDFYKDNLFHNASYLLFVDTKYKSGLPITFYLDNPFEYRPEIETRLSKKNTENVIVIPKTENYFRGYGFHFIVKSLGKETAESAIGKVSLYPFPLDTLKNFKIIRPSILTEKDFATKKPVEFKKIGNFIYKVDKISKNNYLVLSQSFDKGWKAYQINSNFKLAEAFPSVFGKEIKDHVLVNNWENGWIIDNLTIKQSFDKAQDKSNNATIVLIYLPQYLEYLGFGFLLIILLMLGLKRFDNK